MSFTTAQRQCLSRSHAYQAGHNFPIRRNCTTPIHFQRLQHRNSKYRQVTTMGLFGLGLPEVAVVAGIAVLVFGPSKLPELGKELGKTVKSFQTAAKEFETELKNATDEAADKIEEKAEQAKGEIKK